jgi:hypothetical protein
MCALAAHNVATARLLWGSELPTLRQRVTLDRQLDGKPLDLLVVLRVLVPLETERPDIPNTHAG